MGFFCLRFSIYSIKMLVFCSFCAELELGQNKHNEEGRGGGGGEVYLSNRGMDRQLNWSSPPEKKPNCVPTVTETYSSHNHLITTLNNSEVWQQHWNPFGPTSLKGSSLILLLCTACWSLYYWCAWVLLSSSADSEMDLNLSPKTFLNSRVNQNTFFERNG